MRLFLRYVSGFILGVVITLWAPLLLSTTIMPSIPVDSPENDFAQEQSEEDPRTAQTPPRKTMASVSVSETLRTGNPSSTNGDIAPIQGELPRNLRFRWNDDPASGLAPGFLWIKDGNYQLGTQRIAPQDGDIRNAYAFEAPALLPSQYDGRLIFHRKLLNRLIQWSSELEEVANDALLVVSVERVNSRTIRLLLPAINSTPATQLTVTL